MKKTSLEDLASEWWTVGLRGVLAIAVGIAVVVSPVPHVDHLLRVFGVYLLVDGVLVLLTAAVAIRDHQGWVRPAINGALGVYFGYINIADTGLPASTRADLVALRTFLLGVSGLLVAWEVRGVLPDTLPQWLLALAAIGSILFSLVIFFGPAIDAKALGRLDWLGALYLVVFGCLLLLVAARSRTLLVHTRVTGVTV